MLGNYTPKVCYKTLFEGQEVADTIWWCKSLWKFKCPLKTQIFKWMELNNEVLTWDIRQKRSWRGPNKYPLCVGPHPVLTMLFAYIIYHNLHSYASTTLLTSF
jgi:hypothetical protein